MAGALGTAALDGLRVLDITGRRGGYCGKLLANFGADVVLVEPRGGDPMRRQPPFRTQQPNPDESLSFLAYQTNKSGIELDLESRSGAKQLRKLARNADILICDRPPADLDRLGLSHRRLGRLNPKLITVSITGFGQSGPYSWFASTDIVSMAMGGLMSTAGFPSRAPLQGPGEAAHKMASIHAAFGILVALLNRNSTGRGQHVEVSEQEVLAADPFRRMVLDYAVRAEFVERDGTISAELVAGSYPTKDGYANFYIQVPSHWRRLVEWLGSPAEISDTSFEKEDVQRAHRGTIDSLIEAKSSGYGKQELTDELQGLHLAVGAVNTVGEFLADEQTQFRQFVGAVDQPGKPSAEHPGDPYIFSETPWRITRGAPRLDQHRSEVLARFSQPSPWSSLAASYGLKGIRVISFPTGVVGPCIGRLLGDHGAEVIAIEAKEKPADGTPAPLNAWTLAQIESNRSRKRLSLDMNTQEARELARQLIARADVLTENFSARVMQKWGLDYANVLKINPNIVMISLQSFGNAGPKGPWISYGSTLLALSGYSLLWQDPDRTEQGVGCNTYFPDYVAPSYGALAVMAALHHRARTGRGQYIDLSQAETAAALLGTELVECLDAGREPEPAANRSAFMVPHGCYRCLGSDRWCVIAVEDESQWHAMCRVMEHTEWMAEAKFADFGARLAHREQLDGLISEWTSRHTPHQVMVKLQRAGVPAGVVANSEDLFLDPHMRQRGFTRDVPSAKYGWITQVGRTVNLSDTPGPPLDEAREIGADNREVLSSSLGLTDKEIDDLQSRGILG
jgi:crotonobetainyl-CoA:carnitine CoA-transferase CaiB-like acyl-CoA transferase